MAQKREAGAVVGSQYCLQKAEQFTLENVICTKSWSITSADGKEVFRVRGPRVDGFKAKRELIDLDGNTIVFMEQKPWSCTGVWTAFKPGNREHPLWTLKKSSFWGLGPAMHVFLPSNAAQEVPDYTIKGSWLCKECTIFLGDQKVAEIMREVSMKNVLIDKSIFHVSVQPHVDMAFIFSLILIKDKLYIHNMTNRGGSPGCYAPM